MSTTDSQSSPSTPPVPATPPATVLPEATHVNSVVQSQLHKDSPLQLLNGIPLQGTIADPAALANQLLAKQFQQSKAQEKPAEQPAPTVVQVDQKPGTPLAKAGTEAQNLLKSIEPAPVQLQAIPVVPSILQTPQTPIDGDALRELDKALAGVAPTVTAPATPAVQHPDPLADIPEELPQEVDGKSTAAENFKKLRTRTKALNTTLQERELKLTELETELNKFKSGEAMPDVIKEKEDKIQELSKYRELVDLKTSPEYHKTYIAPLNDLGAQLDTYSTEYEVPPDVLHTALQLTKPAELSRFLSNHFDPAAALEVKQIVNKMQTLHTEAQDAQNKPAQALQVLQAEHKQLADIQETQRTSQIADTSRNAWVRQVNRIKDEGEATELIWQEDNTEHNQNVVQPLQVAAAREYGVLIRNLAEKGLTELEPGFADSLARMILLAHASAVSIKSRQATSDHAQALEENATHLNRLLRPSIGANGYSSGVVEEKQNKAPPSPQAAGRQLLQDILRR